MTLYMVQGLGFRLEHSVLDWDKHRTYFALFVWIVFFAGEGWGGERVKDQSFVELPE